MSSYQSRCGEIRRRVLEGESQSALAREDRMPGVSTLGRHLRGECICGTAIPPVESVGKGPEIKYRVTEAAACPDCGSDVSVETRDGFEPRWDCLDCELAFGLDALARTPRVVPDGGTTGRTDTGPDASDPTDRIAPIETRPVESGYVVEATRHVRQTIARACALYSSWAGSEGHTQTQWHYEDLAQKWGTPQPRVDAVDLIETAAACSFTALRNPEDAPSPETCRRLAEALRTHARVDSDDREIRTDGGEDDFRKLLDGVRDGRPTKHQLEPDEFDPVCEETADEAEETLQKTGLVNPFHAVELQRRQNERRREQRENEPNPIIAELESEGFDDE